MIYKLTFRCDEVDDFKRVFEADSEATFLDLHKAILASAKYADDQMTSFFMCNDNWEKEQEVTLLEMDKNFEFDNLVMESTRLSELLYEPKQRLIYVFDPMFERFFYGSLTEIKAGTMEGVKCTENKGKAPKQVQELEDLKADTQASVLDEDDFYGDDGFDMDELDSEGFQDLSFDDGTMF